MKWKCDKCEIICAQYYQLQNHKNLRCFNNTDNHGASSSYQNIELNTGHITPTLFVDCCKTIKEEIKEEKVEFDDPLRLQCEKPFECDICKKLFAPRGNRDTHKRIYTREKPFQCNICGKYFTSRTGVSQHKRIHTVGKKPFQCGICGKYFRTRMQVSVHKRIHTGEKPFQCDICKKAFSQIGNLDRHKLIHTGEKPFHCDICNTAFIKKSDLDRHTRTKSHCRQLNVHKKKCSGQSSLNENETASSSEAQDKIELAGEEVMDDTSDDFDFIENLISEFDSENFDLSANIFSDLIDIEEHKLQAISEEGYELEKPVNKLIECGRQVLFEHSYFKPEVADKQISDTINRKPAENEEPSPNQYCNNTKKEIGDNLTDRHRQTSSNFAVLNDICIFLFSKSSATNTYTSQISTQFILNF